jgi:flagellar hook-basal body complex protein FliE
MKLGEVLNNIGSIDSSKISNIVKNEPVGDSFSDVLKSAMHDVNDKQVQAYSAMEEISTGKVENLQKAVQQIEEAELSLKLGLEVKNKALSAYKQVMQMSI